MNVLVTTYKEDVDEKPLERTIDFSKHDMRQWFVKHCSWAFDNGYVVEAVNEKDIQNAG